MQTPPFQCYKDIAWKKKNFYFLHENKTQQPWIQLCKIGCESSETKSWCHRIKTFFVQNFASHSSLKHTFCDKKKSIRLPHRSYKRIFFLLKCCNNNVCNWIYVFKSDRNLQQYVITRCVSHCCVIRYNLIKSCE